ncbi:MAG: T9SS type A sorting domain-containing protein [bacterium]
MRKVLLGLFVLMLVGSASAQTVLYSESFANNTLHETWFPVWGDNNIVAPVADAEAPDGDGYIGEMAAGEMGVGTACVGDASLPSDYTVEAMIYTVVSAAAGGPYNGIVARFDTTGGGHDYYYLRADFDTDARLQLRVYPGESTYGDDIAAWTTNLPGGVPIESSWHKMTLTVQGNQLYAWWDSQLLPGCPFTNSAISTGYAGVYAFSFMGVSTMVDDFKVMSATTSAPEVADAALPRSIEIVNAYPNPFNPETTISFRSQQVPQASLVVYDVMGRPVTTLLKGALSAGEHAVSFRAANLPAGTYFLRLEAAGVQDVRRVTLVK